MGRGTCPRSHLPHNTANPRAPLRTPSPTSPPPTLARTVEASGGSQRPLRLHGGCQRFAQASCSARGGRAGCPPLRRGRSARGRALALALAWARLMPRGALAHWDALAAVALALPSVALALSMALPRVARLALPRVALALAMVHVAGPGPQRGAQLKGADLR
jgi:hypothetical protein